MPQDSILEFVVELEQTLTVDGVYKLLFAINGEFPGPPIIVYEGQTVCLSLSPFFINFGCKIEKERER